MKIHYCTQASPEWWELRRGIPTASGFDRILTPTGKKSAQWDGYIAELAADTQCQTPSFFSQYGVRTGAMEHGTATEPDARRWYSVERDVDVRQVGFCMSDDGRYGCSPDGLVGDDGALELKCPQPKTQAKYILKGYDCLPTEYKPQVHGHLIVTERPWVDFMSYCPGFRCILVRVEPDAYTKLLAEAVAEFLERYEQELREKYKLKPVWEEAALGR